MPKFKRAVLIGRFQPVHNGHLSNFLEGLAVADKIIILVGSCFQARTPKNPFSFEERASMIRDSLITQGISESRFSIHSLQDFKYSNNRWIAHVQETVKKDSPDVQDSDITIVGYDKDDSSWYNHAFPRWHFTGLTGYVRYGANPIDATKIRELYFEGHLDFLSGVAPQSTFSFLDSWSKTDFYKEMVEEHSFYKGYHELWKNAPFVPVFQTTDAVVVQGGHILLVQRKHSPGRGLWALPGGFINPKERLEDCVIRELIEETKIKVPEIILRKAITHSEIFDHPDRDLRGRTITNAYLIELSGGDGKLPRVRGSDDARVAEWFNLYEVATMSDKLYGDHAHIIETMIAKARK